MVHFTNTLLYTLLATTASAQLRNDRRHHHHRRKAPCTTGTGLPVTTGTVGAPFPVGNSTNVGPTGTAAITTVASTSIVIQTITVVPVPPSSIPDAAPSSAASPGSGSDSGSGPGSGSGSGAGSGGSCGPATVTVTAQNTVTVTVGGSPSTTSVAPIESPSTPSVPVASPSTPAVTSSSAAAAAPSTPAATPTSAAAVPVKPSPLPVQASSSVPDAPANIPSPSPESTSTSAAAAATSSAPVSSGSGSSCGKAGVAYTGSGQVGAGTAFTDLCWAYDWAYDAMGMSGLEYVPCLQKPEFAAGFSSAIGSMSDVKFLKSLNEPDATVGMGGCQLDPGTAAGIHSGAMNAFSGTYGIGTPAVTSHDSSYWDATGLPSGLTWLSQFAGACSGCKFDFVDLHFYGGAGTGSEQGQAFLDYVSTAISTVDKIFPGQNLPLWFSELGTSQTPEADPQASIDFLNTVIPQLESNPRVARYAYFQASFLESGSALNSVGNTFISGAASAPS